LCAVGAAANAAAAPAAALPLLKWLASWRRSGPANQQPAAAAAAAAAAATLELQVWCLLVERVLLLPSDSPTAGAQGAAECASSVAVLVSTAVGAAAGDALGDLAEALLLPLKTMQSLRCMQKLLLEDPSLESLQESQQMLVQLLPQVSSCWCRVLQELLQALGPAAGFVTALAAANRPMVTLQQLLQLQGLPKALAAALEGPDVGLQSDINNAFAWLTGVSAKAPAAAAAAAAAPELFSAAANMVNAAGQLALRMCQALSEQQSMTEAKAAVASSRTGRAKSSAVAAAGVALTPPKSPMRSLLGVAAAGVSVQLGSVATGYTASGFGTAATAAAGSGSSVTLSAAAERGIAKAAGRLAVQQQQVLVTCLQVQLGLLSAAADAYQGLLAGASSSGSSSSSSAAADSSSSLHQIADLCCELAGMAAACLCRVPDADTAAALLEDQLLPVLLQLLDMSSSSKAGKAPAAAAAAAAGGYAVQLASGVLPVLLERLLQLQAAVQQQAVGEEVAEEALRAAYRTIQR
jgi:hypothetical protein